MKKDLQTISSTLMKARKGTPIDDHGIGEEVVKMKRNGMSAIRIANMVNKEFKDELDGDVITPRMVQTWLRTNIVEYQDVDKQNEIINTYNEQKKLLKIVDTQIDIVNVFIDDFENRLATTTDMDELYQQIRNATMDLEKYISRKESILRELQDIQDKIYNVQTLSEINRQVLTTLKQTDEKVYNEVVDKMRVNPILLSAYEKAKDINI